MKKDKIFTSELKSYLNARRKKEILDVKQNGILQAQKAIELNDITQVDMSSRTGRTYEEIIINHYGQKIWDKELERRKEIRKQRVKELNKARSKIHLDKPYYEIPKELSQNTWNIRKKRIEEIGLEAYKKEQLEKKKEYQKLYILKNKEKRKKYNQENEHLAKEQRKRYRAKNRDKICFKQREKYELDENFRNKIKKCNLKNLQKNIQRKKELGLNNKYSEEDKEKIMNGTFFTEKAKEMRIKKLSCKKKDKDLLIEDFLKKKSYEDSLKFFSEAEPLFKDSFIIDLEANSIFSLDSKCFYGVYLKNENIFDLLLKDENGFTFGIVGKNNSRENKKKRAIVKQVSFQKWEEVEIFAKALQKGF